MTLILHIIIWLWRTKFSLPSLLLIVKKVLHIVLSMLLLLATTGVSISKHYCMGRLMEVKLSQDKPAFCCLSDESDEAGCCEGESEFINLDEDYTHDASLSLPGSDWHIITSSTYLEQAFSLLSIPFLHPEAHAPPLISTPRFILHGVFLI